MTNRFSVPGAGPDDPTRGPEPPGRAGRLLVDRAPRHQVGQHRQDFP